MSVVREARSDVDGFGGREARKSPYAGPSWSFRSRVHGQNPVVVVREGSRTIYGLALCHVVVVLARQ